jgi:gas vesicle protein
MADGYDRFDNESGGGGSFVMGLLTGTVLGAGLGMLFAPKSGSELRSQISEQAGNIANTASEQYRRATEAAGEWAEKGREVGRDVYDKARDAVARGTDEAQRYVRDATGGKSTPSAGSSTSTFGTGSAYGGENIRGASNEGPTRPPSGGGSRRS